MPDAIIEHVNITVSDPARTARMLMDLFDWTVRWEGSAASGGHTIHVGSAAGYVAVYGAPDRTGAPLNHAKSAPLNHIAIEVADLAATEARALAMGLTPFNHGSYEPGRRFYLYDVDGIEWEIVSYTD
jgi:catechol 2,3-dioxygenase-like lactoylglutathione lyase family enzyme